MPQWSLLPCNSLIDKTVILYPQRQRPLLIVAEDVESDALATLILNKLRAGIKVFRSHVGCCYSGFIGFSPFKWLKLWKLMCGSESKIALFVEHEKYGFLGIGKHIISKIWKRYIYCFQWFLCEPWRGSQLMIIHAIKSLRNTYLHFVPQ